MKGYFEVGQIIIVNGLGLVVVEFLGAYAICTDGVGYYIISARQKGFRAFGTWYTIFVSEARRKMLSLADPGAARAIQVQELERRGKMPDMFHTPYRVHQSYRTRRY